MANPASFKSNLIYGFLPALVGAMFCLPFGISLYSALALGLTIFIFYLFLDQLGKGIPIREMILLMTSMQWLLGPVLAYNEKTHHYKYYMYVPEEEYMPFAIGGVLVLLAGLYLIHIPKEKYLHAQLLPWIKKQLQQDPNISFKLILLGIACSFAQRFLPGSIAFIFYLFGNSMYIGVIYMIFQKPKMKWWGLGGAFLFMFLGSMQSSMFHELLLWMAFFSFYLSLTTPISFGRKLLILMGGIGLMYIFQVVKWDLRNGYRNGGAFSTFFTIVDNKILNAPESSLDETNSGTESFIIRLNQGWIISRIMYYIPNEAPYVDGETVMDAISASLLPRFLNPGKNVVGGQAYFERFTGMVLAADTSMGASLLGEGYANFGMSGALLFLLCYGLAIGFMLKKVYDFAHNHPTLLLWLPLLFLQVVKAESDLVRVLNHAVKASILVWVLYLVLGRMLKWKI